MKKTELVHLTICLIFLLLLSMFPLPKRTDILAEQSGSSPESGTDSYLKTLYDSLASLGYGSTAAGSWGDWGAYWNRLRSAAEWVPSGDVSAEDVVSGKTFYADSRIEETGIMSTCKFPDSGQTTSQGTAPDDADYDSTNCCTCDPSYTDNGDGTVTDNCTGLIWCKDGNSDCCYNGISMAMWENAKSACEDLDSTYDDWRLPTIKELQSIIDYGSINPAIDPIFTNTAAYIYWSSTASINLDYAWIINFYDGSISPTDVYGFFSVRCVREE